MMVRPTVLWQPRGALSRGYAFSPGRTGACLPRGIGGVGGTASEWFVFLDADDLLVPGTLGRRLEAAEAPGAEVVVCDWQEFVDHDGRIEDGPVRSVDMAALAADAEIGCATHVWAPPCAIMYRRSLVEKIGGFREDLPVIEDARFLFDAAYHRARFAHSAHVGARHRLSPQSLSRCDPARFWRYVLLNGKQIETLWRARGPLPPQRREALTEIYNNAARGLFAATHPEYFEAVDCQRKLGGKLPLHPQIAAPLARAIGLRQARQLLRIVGR